MPQKPPGKGGWGTTTTTTREGERGGLVAQRSGQGTTYHCSPLPHMDTIWMWNTMHACSSGPVGRLACGEPSFTPTLNTTTPAVSLRTEVPMTEKADYRYLGWPKRLRPCPQITVNSTDPRPLLSLPAPFRSGAPCSSHGFKRQVEKVPTTSSLRFNWGCTAWPLQSRHRAPP